MKTASLLLVLAGMLSAQYVSRIEVVADTTRIVCGRTFKVRAIAYDPSNKPMAALFTFSTNLGALAPVTEGGTVTAKAPGVIRVKATLWGSSFANEISIQSVPARMEITPAVTQMTMGERRNFTFKAFDADGREVPTPTVSWSMLHGNGYPSVAASVSQQGAVYALAEGDLVLQAGFNYEPTLAGFQRQSYTTIPLKIRPREFYRLRKIPLPSENPGGLYRGMRLNSIAPNESGQFLQIAPVGAASAASLLWDGERYKPVLATGREGSQASSPIGEINGNAMNDRGEVVIHAANALGGSVLFRGDIENQVWILSDNSPIGSSGIVNGGFAVSRFSLNNDGHLLLFVNYSPRPGIPARQGLFRIEPDGFVYLVADADTALPGLDSPVRFDTSTYGTPSGRDSWFLVSNGANTALYRRRGFDPIERVLGTGDELQGSRIRTIVPGQNFWLSRSGDVAVVVQLDNGQTWLGFLPSGNAATASWTRINGWQRICGTRPDGRIWFYGAPLNQPTGLHLLQGTQSTRILSDGNSRIDGEIVVNSFDCFVDAQDRPLALLNTAKDYFLLTRFEGTEPTVLTKGGDPVAGSLRPFFTGFVQGKRDGEPYLSGGSWTSHVWRLSDSTLEPVLLPGNSLRAGTWFAGGNLAANDAGQVATTSNNKYDTLRWSPGNEASVIFTSGQTLEDSTRLNGGYGARLNNRGTTLTIHSTSRGDTRMVLNRTGSPEFILSTGVWPDLTFTIEGLGMATGWGEYALDDADRVLALITSSEGRSAWCLWENGAWRVAFYPTTPVAHRTVLGYNNLRVSGETFYLRFNTVAGMAGLAIFDRAGLRILVDPEDNAANGNMFNSPGPFQINSRGEAAILNFSFASQVIGVLRNGTMRHIYSQTAATREGDVLFRTQDMIIMNDGRVYILAITPDERQVLYEATPVD